MMVQQALERIIPEHLLISLKKQGKTDKEIAENFNISPADILLLRGWYGIEPLHIKPPKPLSGHKRKPVKRPALHILKILHRYNCIKISSILKNQRNEEIYLQYKNGADVKKLTKMYFLNDVYLIGLIARKHREERVKNSQEYLTAKGKALSRDLQKNTKLRENPILISVCCTGFLQVRSVNFESDSK